MLRADQKINRDAVTELGDEENFRLYQFGQALVAE